MSESDYRLTKAVQQRVLRGVRDFERRSRLKKATMSKVTHFQALKAIRAINLAAESADPGLVIRSIVAWAYGVDTEEIQGLDYAGVVELTERMDRLRAENE